MEQSDQNPVDDGVTNDLLVVNELIYKIPPDLNIAQSRTQKLYRAGQNAYGYGFSGQGPTVEIMVQSGLEYIDPGNSTIEFDISFSMETTYNHNWAEKYRALAGGSPADGAIPSLLTTTDNKSTGGSVTDTVALTIPTRACTRAGKWWLDGSLSLIDTIELIHSSGQSLQKIVEVGPLANITHQFKYNYDRNTPSANSHSQLNFANISHTFYSGLQAEMDGYQLINPFITYSGANKATMSNPNLIAGVLDTITGAKQGTMHNREVSMNASLGTFWKINPEGVDISAAALDLRPGLEMVLTPDTSMHDQTKQQVPSMVQNLVNSILTAAPTTINKGGSVAPYRAWAGDWFTGTTVTQEIKSHVVIPLSRIPGIFEVDQMLPPQLMSGLKIQMKMALPSQGLTYFYNTGINAVRNNAGVKPNKLSITPQKFDPLAAGYAVSQGTIYNQTLFNNQRPLLNREVQASAPPNPTNLTKTSALTRLVTSGFDLTSDLSLYQPYTTTHNYPSDLGVLSGRPGEIRQEDFTHRFISGTITNCQLVADSYNLAPAIQRKLDAIAASGQMRLAYPNYTHIIPAVSEQTYQSTSQTQIPISIATENALWAFLGFRPNQASVSYNPNQMYSRFLPYLVSSYQARAGSYYYPADPVRMGQSGTWRDMLPFVRQQMLSTGKLSKNYTGCIDMDQLLPENYKLWVDSGRQCSKYMPTVYHLPCSTMCGLWVSLERSAVLQNSGMPLNQNRQLTFLVEGGLGNGPPGAGAINPFSSQAGVHGDDTFKVYRCEDSFINEGQLSTILQPATGYTPNVKETPLYGGVDSVNGLVNGFYSNQTFIPPYSRIPGSDCIVSLESNLYYQTGVQAICYVASVGYLTILLNTIVKRE